MNNYKVFDIDAILTFTFFMLPYLLIGMFVFGSIVLGLMGVID